jgi:hypothetical protein
MLHALALVKIEDGLSEEFFKPLFQVAFINGHLAAERFDGKRLSNMLEQDLAGFNNLFAVGLITEKFTAELFYFFAHHTLKTVQQQHLGLGIEINIFKTAAVSMIEQSVEHQARTAAEREHLGEGFGMPEADDVFTEYLFSFIGNKLRKMGRGEAKGHHIYRIKYFFAAPRFMYAAMVAFDVFFAAIAVAGHAEAQFKVIFAAVGGIVMVNQHTGIFKLVLGPAEIPFDGIMNGPRYLLLFFLQQYHIGTNGLVVSGQGEYIGGW